MNFRVLGLSHPILAVVLLLTASVGCDNTTPMAADAGGDAFSLTPSSLFGGCVDDSQCPGAGAICRRASEGYPGGYCTVPCDDRTPCDTGSVYHHCVQLTGETRSYCERRCLNGIDCGRDGYTCAGELPPSGGVCIGVCREDEQCGDGTVCDRWTGECVVGPAPTAGAGTGEPCDSGADCRSGRCIQDVQQGQPTGNVFGYCTGNCMLPRGWNSTSLFGGDVLPAGTCPGDVPVVCFPGSQLAVGDLGSCRRSCTGDSDCREGYGCLQSFRLSSGTVSFDNGICVPANCTPTSCPSGYRCVGLPQSDGSTRNVCAPS